MTQDKNKELLTCETFRAASLYITDDVALFGQCWLASTTVLNFQFEKNKKRFWSTV